MPRTTRREPAPVALPAAHEELCARLLHGRDWLIVQDLDGVCMPLVRDPLTRTIDPSYVEAAARLDHRFRVLTNGEHIGRRGVNGIVERACGGADAVRQRRLYLPGLAAGGVQHQGRAGDVTHPGVDERELAFLAEVPQLAGAFLETLLRRPPFRVPDAERPDLIAATILANHVSPTLNINSLHRRFSGDWSLTRTLQEQLQGWMEDRLEAARRSGLSDAFFVHLAPNLGQEDGRERLKPASEQGVGTTDFQFMLRGAVKEAGLLVLLNRHVHRRTGHAPLGAGFNVREAPADRAGLVALARKHFDHQWMPRLIGVGDTVTSERRSIDGHDKQLRGGSDRGFLTLVQELGRVFGTANEVLLVDSSDGEVHRPSLRENPSLLGISDPEDPLRLTATFPGGHLEYIRFFTDLSRRFPGAE
jgi:glucosylglycerol 3-phosphatase